MSRDLQAPEQMRAHRAPPKTFAERLALFVVGVDRVRAGELLAGLAEGSRAHALAVADQAAKWDSATRQGRLAVAFAPHPRAREHLEALFAKASPAMRDALTGGLDPYEKAMFPGLSKTPRAPGCPALAEVAARLIREATR